MKNIEIIIKEDEIAINLCADGSVLDFMVWKDKIDLSERLLVEIDMLIIKNNLVLADIANFEVKSDISDKFTSVKIAQTVAKTLNFYKAVN